MGKNLKYFLFLVVACAAILFVLLKLFNGNQPNSASAFEWEKRVNVYLGSSQSGSLEDCSKVFPVPRTILNAETLGPGALESLLEEVSEEEKAAGYFTSINEGVVLQKFEVKNKVAYVDFDKNLSEAIAGSCKLLAIKSQVENTLNNLPDIDSVVISVNGQTEGILQPQN